MHFNKKIEFKNYSIEIKINKKFFKVKNRYYFGFPVGDKKLFENPDLNFQCRNLSGYFFIIDIIKDRVNFYTDIVGNFRVYYYQENDYLLVTDNLNNIFKKKKKKYFKLNKKIFNFFKLKNYTPGNKTFLDGIMKFQPGSKFSIKNSKQLFIKTYYLNYKNLPNLKNIEKEIDWNLKNQIRLFEKEKVVLFFSGGRDSLLIFFYLLKMKINFECIFYDTKVNSVISGSLEFVKKMCKKNEIKLRIIKIPLSMKSDFKKFLFTEMLFDYHYSFLHFTVFKKLKSIYNQNTVFLSGQSCDSILSFGPSAYTISNFIARYMNLYPTNILSKIFSKIINLKFKNNITSSKNLRNFYVNFYNSFFYYSVGCQNNKSLNDLSLKTIKDLKIEKYDSISKKMYLKCHGFLQGPDNQVFIKTANYFNFNKILLPFANYQLIKSVNKSYNFKTDLIFPKYIVDFLLLKKFNMSKELFIKNVFNKKRKTYRLNLTLKNSNFKKKVINQIKNKYV